MHSTLLPIYSAASIRCDKPFLVTFMAPSMVPLLVFAVALTRCLKIFVFSVSGAADVAEDVGGSDVCIRVCGG